LRLIVCPDPQAAAFAAAAGLADAIRAAVTTRNRAVIAVSGGETPWLMISALRELDVPWNRLHVAQVDERAAPDGDRERNVTRLRELLVATGPLAADRLLPMPVANPDLDAAADDYQRTLERVAGRPVVFDVVHLGLGTDGHTASLVPDDGVLAIEDRDVAPTAPYSGHRRMTLTFPALSRARERLWLVTGATKAAALRDLLAHRGSSPAVRLPVVASSVYCDEAASST
jgi:6-phosphogluconolactonase